MKTRTGLIIILLGILALAAGSGVYFTYGYGTLSVIMTDPPQNWNEATNVYIQYGEITVHRADAGNETGMIKVVDAGWIDLTSVVNVSKTIGQGTLQAGKYNLVRFQVIQAIVTIRGVNFTAEVPPDKITIAITGGGVQVNQGQTSYLVIDINPKVTGSEASSFKLVPAATASPT
ncbi:MAG: DUF4382 domain-containing protein [Candidatus Methanomethylicaceae archaeon]